MNILLPKKYLRSVYDLDFSELKAKEIQGIILDIDNTLVRWDQKEVDEKVKEWINKLIISGFKICFVSNNKASRVIGFSEKFNLPALYKCYKPRKKPFLTAMEIIETNKDNTVVIGDQIFTDILGGNRLGVFTILVKPIGKKEDFKTRLIRNIEKLILNTMNPSMELTGKER